MTLKVKRRRVREVENFMGFEKEERLNKLMATGREKDEKSCEIKKCWVKERETGFA